VKILMSGGTRCNITHDCDERGIVAAYGPNGKFLFSALAALNVADTLALFAAEGVKTKVEPGGKVFPVSNKASDVLAALMRRLHRSGTVLALAEAVTAVTPADGGFVVTTSRRTLRASKVVLAVGGKSYPGSGTTGDGFRIAAALGHTIVPPRPALTPITTDAQWVKQLRGITLENVELRLAGIEKKPLCRRGSLLFAHFGLSGPVALDLSRFVSGHPHPTSLQLHIDILPERSEANVDQWLQEQALAEGKKLLANVLSPLVPHRLAETLLQLAGQPIDRRAAGLTKHDRTCLARLIKSLPVPITGTLGFEKAEVTAGGVALTEVDSSTMQSKLVQGFYFAGEVLDLDGPIGGYNFQAAWSTGWLAGTSAGLDE
jgi:predicted Rossmann fold flavoprotein